MDLVTFLRARVDEDKAEALETADADSEFWAGVSGDGTYFARHDPARVLREVEAKRRIIAEHHVVGGWCVRCVPDNLSDDHGQEPPCNTLRLLALPYSDHPDYQEDWRV